MNDDSNSVTVENMFDARTVQGLISNNIRFI